jgi:hypothetical protein
MAGRFVRGLVTGLVLGVGVVGAVSVLVLPPVRRPQPPAPQPIVVERTYGPPPSDLPRLRSETAPPQPATPTGDE